ncbi:transcriptional regulator [Clostridiales bacterium PH28_bin88]|nr:transcriptional regulator [Clostridiales bacterium PH28_bin88]
MEEKSKPNGGGKDWSQAEMEEIRRLNRELDSIIEASYDGIFITDGQGRVIRVNSSWERITGVSRKYAVGKTAQYMVSRGLYSRSAAVAALKEKKRVTTMLEMTQGKKRGQKIIATGTPIWGEEGEIKMVVVDVRDVTELVSLKQQLEETQRLNQRYTAQLGQMRAQQARYDDIVTGSGIMKRVMEITAQAARVDSTVLITGESGVGKEVIARAIHRLSPRSEGPMITINCGAIPENLLESELFGYEAGAFTGANKQGKPGMFELADKGTLFLDEVGELPINLQVKLLRVLQDHEVMRVGGLSPIAVDTRIVAATNKDLLEMVGHGKFREDLFYRLNVVSIEVPPLRERREDIPPLALHCLEKVNRKYGFQKRLSPAVIDRFLTYSWPGNVRELENVIERMVVMAGGEEILAEHLPAYLSGRNGPADGRVDVHGIIPLKTALEQVERQLISEALEMYGSTRKAARVLEVNQSTIVRKAGKYRILSSGGLEGL